MTRRRVLFRDVVTGQLHATPEFNGDKEELQRMGSADSCEKNWDEIVLEFQGVKTLPEFVKTNVRAQSFYHSQFGTEILTTEKIGKVKVFGSRAYRVWADEVWYCRDGEVSLVH